MLRLLRKFTLVRKIEGVAWFAGLKKNPLTNKATAHKQASTFLTIHEMTIDDLILLLLMRATTLLILESGMCRTMYE
jgi:hypothetical protein